MGGCENRPCFAFLFGVFNQGNQPSHLIFCLTGIHQVRENDEFLSMCYKNKHDGLLFMCIA